MSASLVGSEMCIRDSCRGATRMSSHDRPTDRPTDRPADRHHVAVLAEAQLACRRMRLNRIQNESWFTPPLSQTGSILSFQFGGGTVDLRDCAIQHGAIHASVFLSWTLSAVVFHGRCLPLGDSCATLMLMNICATWPAQPMNQGHATSQFLAESAESSRRRLLPARGVDGTGLYCFLCDICAE